MYPVGGAVTLKVTVTSQYARFSRTVEILSAVDVVFIDLEPAVEY